VTGPIPHKIHRVWLGREMPAEYVEFGRAWQALHPTWEVCTWGEDDLDWLVNRSEFDEATRFTTKANIARYEIVHREGGLYVDCDFEPLRPMDELIDGASLVVGEQQAGGLNNALFAATPGHPVLAYAIEELPRSFAGRRGDHSVATTGPEFWTRCVRRAGAATAEQPVVLTRDQIYPYGFDPGQRHLRHADFDGAFAVHHWADDATPVAAPPSSLAGRLAPDEVRRRIRVQTKRQLGAHVKPRVRGWLRRIGHLPIPLVWGTYVGQNRVLVRTTTGLPLLAFADDLGVTPVLLADGEYDPAFVSFLRRVIERGDVVVDVGANIGLFTLEMARAVGSTGRVFAYEPNPEVNGLLRDNVYLNQNAGRISAEVHCRPVAVGPGPGTATLHVRTRHRAMGSVVNVDAGTAPGETERHQMPVVDLDTELAGIIEVKLVKVDVEGAELDVLRGMGRLLRERRVRIIDLELVDAHAGARWDELAGELRRLQTHLGGQFHLLGADGSLRPVDVEGALHRDRVGHLVIRLPAT